MRRTVFQRWFSPNVNKNFVFIQEITENYGREIWWAYNFWEKMKGFATDDGDYAHDDADGEFE